MEAVLQVMQDIWGYDEGAVWAGSGLGGGVAGMGGICGTVAGAIAAYGLHAGQAVGDDAVAMLEGQKSAMAFARKFYRAFRERFGHSDCRELISYDLSTPEGLKAYVASGILRERCHKYMEYAVRMLIE